MLPRRGWHREWNRWNCLPNCSLPGLISAYPRCLYWKVRNARYQILSWMPWQTSWMYPLTGCWVENEKTPSMRVALTPTAMFILCPVFPWKKQEIRKAKQREKVLNSRFSEKAVFGTIPAAFSSTPFFVKKLEKHRISYRNPVLLWLRRQDSNLRPPGYEFKNRRILSLCNIEKHVDTQHFFGFIV